MEFVAQGCRERDQIWKNLSASRQSPRCSIDGREIVSALLNPGIQPASLTRFSPSHVVSGTRCPLNNCLNDHFNVKRGIKLIEIGETQGFLEHTEPQTGLAVE